MPLFFASCSNDDFAAIEEAVQVSFHAEIPTQMETRATSTLSVDKVYCAVFENNVEIPTLREEIDIVDGQDIIFAPRLIKGRSYDVVFWASKEGSYDVSDMTAITRAANNATATEADYDAFTAKTKISVSQTSYRPVGVTLKRPMAQLNMGVTPENWEHVASQNILPATITIQIPGHSTFDALTGKTVGEENIITYNLAVSGSEFTCNEKTYKSIAMCYILSEPEEESKDITYSTYDQAGNAIRENVCIPSVLLKRNYKTNVVGNLLTRAVSYAVTVDDSQLLTDD